MDKFPFGSNEAADEVEDDDDNVAFGSVLVGFISSSARSAEDKNTEDELINPESSCVDSSDCLVLQLSSVSETYVPDFGSDMIGLTDGDLGDFNRQLNQMIVLDSISMISTYTK